MGLQLNLKLQGLYTSANELSSNPQGGLSVADNVVIDFDNLAQSRRGFTSLTGSFNFGSNRANRYTQFQDLLVAHNGTATVSRYNGTSWVDYSGSFPPPSATTAKTKFLGANRNLYFTSSNGIYKLDSVSGTPSRAGIDKGLDISATTTGASGFMATNSQVAYRMLWGTKDANKNLVLGAPSGRATVANTSGATRNVAITFTIPAGITTSNFYQVYRSVQTISSTVEPNDELQLVYEGNPTPAEIAAKVVTFTDITPDALKGATLYTSPSQQGILQANEQPVYATDFTEYKGYVFYSNVRTKNRLFLTVLAAGTAPGIVVGDTLTIGTVTYTAAVAENIAANEFEVFTAGTPAQNIADTTNSLIRVINRSASNTTYYGYYISGFNDLPGKILIEERSVGGASVAATSSQGTAYSPTLPTSGTAVSSTVDTNRNGIYFSKLQQPEAVPLVNLLFAGNADNDILRILPLRDSVIILKTDGVFRITGSSDANFQVDPFDLTCRIFSPESAVVLANEVWMLSDQGVVSVSDTGTQVRSRPIENQLIALFGDALDKVKSLSFGVAYETDRKYILFTVTSNADTAPAQAFVFNTFTSTWTRWTRSQTAGFVNPVDNKLYLGDATSSKTNIERKTYTYTDFVDESRGAYTVTAVDNELKTLTVTSVSGVEVGDLVFQTSTLFANVVAVDNVTNTITLSSSAPFTVAPVEILKGISCKLEWNPQAADNPGQIRQMQEIVALFRSTRFYSAFFRFRSELSQNFDTVEVFGASQGGWGLFGWGEVPWGGNLDPKNLRTYVTQDKQYCSQFTFQLEIKNGYSDWKLQGISIPYNTIGFEVTK